jgi:hypothetical protein
MASLLGSFMKKPDAAQAANPAAPPASPEPDDGSRLRLYKIIIDRYREEIEEHENKTVVDLKGMIQPHEPTIQKTRDSLLESFRPYIYQEHFLPALKMCCQYVSSFQTISPPVAFWLTFQDMQSIMAGDEIDKSILLCSLLRSLGSQSARVFVTDTKNSYVICQFEGKFYLMAHSAAEPSICASEQEAMLRMSGKPIYSFNDMDYVNLSEED